MNQTGKGEQSGETGESRSRREPKAVTLRAFLLGLGLTAVLALTLPYFELWAGGGRCMGGLTYPAVWSLIFVMIPLGWLLSLAGRHLSFSRGEILFTFSMVSVSALIPSLALVTHIFPVLTAPGYYGKTKEFLEFADRYSPWWLYPRDPKVSTWFYEKLPELESIPWREWVVPLAAWSLFAILLYVTMAALALLLHRQWIQHEHLSFPDLQMPVAMAEERRGIPGAALPTNLPLLIGVSLPAFVHGLNGLNFHYPTVVPAIKLDTWVNFSGGILRDAIGGIWLPFRLILVGLAFLMPLDVSFSIWFFHVMEWVARIVISALGILPGGGAQVGQLYYACSCGGFLVLAAYYVFRVFRFSVRSPGLGFGNCTRILGWRWRGSWG